MVNTGKFNLFHQYSCTCMRVKKDSLNQYLQSIRDPYHFFLQFNRDPLKKY
jgi:hypothetical protein